MKKVLIVTYYWPPSGGAGVQRWLKFSKYLPEFGCEPIILTVDLAYATYPVLDRTLENDVPASLKVYRTKATDWFKIYDKNKSKVPSAGFAKNNDNSIKGKISRFVRGNFFLPDPRRGWNRYAIREASSIIRRENINTVITTSPPHSSQLIGRCLKKRFPEITWIADLRDTWTDIFYYDLFYPTFIAKSIDKNYEKTILLNADKIVTVGQNLAETYISRAEGVNEKIHIIPNGYDEDDFREINYGFPERYTITYVGTLSDVYPLDAFLAALTRIEKRGKDFLLRLVGSVSTEIKMKINSQLSSDKTEFIPYVDHVQAIKYMAESSLLLLIIPEQKKEKTHTPGKVFEYIATRKPILYIGPSDGDAAYHLKVCGQTGGIFSEQNFEEIAKYIEENMKSKGPLLYMPHPEYSRRILTQNLARILKGN